MATVPDIIETLGNPAAIARATGLPLTTVDSWKRSGYVPAWRVPTLVALAKKLGKPISAADFPASRPDTTPSTTEKAA